MFLLLFSKFAFLDKKNFFPILEIETQNIREQFYLGYEFFVFFFNVASPSNKPWLEVCQIFGHFSFFPVVLS